MLLLSLLTSVVGYGLLPAQMRIHWTLGLGPYHGPEFAPTLLVLSLFPVLIAAAGVLAFTLETLVEQPLEVARIRSYYVVGLLGTLGVLVGTQILLVVANL